MSQEINRIIAIEDLPEIPAIDNSTVEAEILREKLADALIPFYQVEFDPEEAERAGAFVEDALSEADAAESAADLIRSAVPNVEPES